MTIDGDIPRIDGVAALLPVYAGFVESIYPEDSVIFNGEDYDHSSAMHYTNTRGAYKDIVDGNADIIICAQPSDEQLAYAEENGVEISEEMRSMIEAQKKQDVVSALGEEGTEEAFFAYLENIRLSPEMYDRIVTQNFLYQEGTHFSVNI